MQEKTGGCELIRGRGRRSQVYFPPRLRRRRRLIARQRRHVNDGNDGAGEVKANGCIQCTKRSFVPDMWLTESSSRFSLAGAQGEIIVEHFEDDAPGAARNIGKDALLTPLGAFIVGNLHGNGFAGRMFTSSTNRESRLRLRAPLLERISATQTSRLCHRPTARVRSHQHPSLKAESLIIYCSGNSFIAATRMRKIIFFFRQSRDPITLEQQLSLGTK